MRVRKSENADPFASDYNERVEKGEEVKLHNDILHMRITLVETYQYPEKQCDWNVERVICWATWKKNVIASHLKPNSATASSLFHPPTS